MTNIYKLTITNIDTIKLHEGIHNIQFGMSKNDILNRLDSEYIEKTDEYDDIDIIFPKLNLRFTFWKNYDYKLGYIESERKKSTLLGIKLIGSSKDGIRAFIKNKLNSEITEESGCEHEDGDIQEWIEVDKKSLCFWFMNNSLYQICWSCEWVNNDMPKW